MRQALAEALTKQLLHTDFEVTHTEAHTLKHLRQRPHASTDTHSKLTQTELGTPLALNAAGRDCTAQTRRSAAAGSRRLQYFRLSQRNKLLLTELTVGLAVGEAEGAVVGEAWRTEEHVSQLVHN